MPVDGVVIDGCLGGGPQPSDRGKPAGAGRAGHRGQRGRGEPDRAADAAGDGGGQGQLACTGWPIWWRWPKGRRPATPASPTGRRGCIRRLVHILSFSAFGYWMWATGGDVRYAINISAAVLIITCPCALGLAVPAVITSASWQAVPQGASDQARHGAGAAGRGRYGGLRQDRHADPGRAGAGRPGRPSGRDAVAVAAALGGGVVASLWRGRWRTARVLRGSPRRRSTDMREVPGHGIEGLWQRRARPAGPGRLVRRRRPLAATATYLCSWRAQTHAFTFTDRPRPGADEAVAALQARRDEDRAAVRRCRSPGARDLADRLGIADWQRRGAARRKGRAGGRAVGAKAARC